MNNLKPHVDSGLWVFGGASLDEPIKEGEPPKINGSVMLAVADTKEEVMKNVKEDVYFKSGVWDESKVSFFLRSLAGGKTKCRIACRFMATSTATRLLFLPALLLLQGQVPFRCMATSSLLFLAAEVVRHISI